MLVFKSDITNYWKSLSIFPNCASLPGLLPWHSSGLIISYMNWCISLLIVISCHQSSSSFSNLSSWSRDLSYAENTTSLLCLRFSNVSTVFSIKVLSLRHVMQSLACYSSRSLITFSFWKIPCFFFFFTFFFFYLHRCTTHCLDWSFHPRLQIHLWYHLSLISNLSLPWCFLFLL